jgi:hypothetical protein
MIKDIEQSSKDSVWLTVKGFSVRVLSTDEGVLVDIWQVNKEDAEVVASTYALDCEIEEEE